MNDKKMRCLFKWKSLAGATIGALMLAPTMTFADGARDWINAPIDTNYLFLYYTFNNAATTPGSALPIDGVNVNANVPILRYARTFDLGGNVGGFQFIVPYASINAELQGTSFKTSNHGIGDVTAIFIANLFGAPALSKEEILRWKPETYLTSSLFITAPTGKYHSNKLLNIGANRWAFKPQLSWGKPFDWGGLLAVNTNVEFFTNNTGYHGAGTLKQDPLYSIEAHYSQNLNSAFWVGVDAFYTHGGRTRVNNVKKDNSQSTLKLGMSASYNFTPFNALTASFNSTVKKRSSTPSSSTFSIDFSHAW